jgi:hypothetical protein
MSQHDEDRIDKLIEQVEKMNRGLYGDEENKQKGLMQVVYENVDDVKQLKEKAQRRTWMIAGASSTGSLLLPVVWEWMKKTFGL